MKPNMTQLVTASNLYNSWKKILKLVFFKPIFVKTISTSKIVQFICFQLNKVLWGVWNIIGLAVAEFRVRTGADAIVTSVLYKSPWIYFHLLWLQSSYVFFKNLKWQYFLRWFIPMWAEPINVKEGKWATSDDRVYNNCQPTGRLHCLLGMVRQ